MKKVMFFMSVFALPAMLFGQNKKDRDAIKSMCGCYEVTFRYAETFQEGADSTYVPSKNSKSKALEWVEILEDKKDKIVLQHYLIAGRGEKMHIIKHWRQDWLYENTDFYQFYLGNKWSFSSKSKKDVKGQWTQKVFQVDDSPRYEQSATWVHVDGKSFWESEVSAPLPRREEKRGDYNVMHRRNRHEITSYGWLHEQDNDKVLRREGKDDFIVAQEKGYNTYKKVADEKCQKAQEYAEKHKEKWALVRAEWDKVFGRKKDLIYNEKVDGKALFEYLFDENNYKDAKSIREVISKYIQ